MQACKFIRENLAISTDKLGKEVLINCAKTAMSSKIVGSEGSFFAQMAVEATQAVKLTKADGQVVYPVNSINVLKAHGKRAKESRVFGGYAIATGRASQVGPAPAAALQPHGHDQCRAPMARLTHMSLQGMPRSVKPAKIACLDMNLQKARMHMGVQVLVTDPAELEKIRGREADIIKERIQKLLAAGANVVLTTKGIDDLSLKYFVEQGVLACRRVPSEDLRRAVPAFSPTFACGCLAALPHGPTDGALSQLLLSAGGLQNQLVRLWSARWPTWMATRASKPPPWELPKRRAGTGVLCSPPAMNGIVT